MKLQKNKNCPDNINKGLKKFKLVEEFQGKHEIVEFNFVVIFILNIALVQ